MQQLLVGSLSLSTREGECSSYWLVHFHFPQGRVNAAVIGSLSLSMEFPINLLRTKVKQSRGNPAGHVNRG